MRFRNEKLYHRFIYIRPDHTRCSVRSRAQNVTKIAKAPSDKPPATSTTISDKQRQLTDNKRLKLSPQNPVRFPALNDGTHTTSSCVHINHWTINSEQKFFCQNNGKALLISQCCIQVCISNIPTMQQWNDDENINCIVQLIYMKIKIPSNSLSPLSDSRLSCRFKLN